MDDAIYRILDANLNRAREGLRVIEEYLRFVREDRHGSWLAKRWRHQLRQIVHCLDNEKLLAARAASSDVGKDFTSPSNASKTDAREITVAGIKRLQESLRVIEEYSAAVDPSVNQLAGRMRFEVYQFEKELLTADPRARFAEVRLYLLIGSDFCPPDEIVDRSKQLLEAGVDCLQLREKKLPDREIFPLAEKLSEICSAMGKIFIVNDRPDIALAIGAHGVHVGQDDLPVPVVRQILGSDRIIGVSTHNPTQLQAAIDIQPTYIAVGPAFQTATKPHEPVAGLEYIAQSVKLLHDAGIPEVAIGGITIENLPKLMDLGVRRIAVCGAVLSADDPVKQVEKFNSILVLG